MNSYPKILLITEGDKTEYNFFKNLFEKFEIKVQIFSVGCNIYSLYQYVCKYDKNVNIKFAVKDLIRKKNSLDEETEEILSLNFAYTYLVFDMDIHHNKPEYKYNYFENKKLLKEILEYFDNETDDTRGKLYLNYPMMESYRDLDGFNDFNYIFRRINVDESSNYKQIVSKRKISGINILNYTKSNYLSIWVLNSKKLLSINKIKIILRKDYDKYYSPRYIYSVVKSVMDTENKIFVLNSSIFLLSDYNINKCVDKNSNYIVKITIYDMLNVAVYNFKNKLKILFSKIQHFIF